MTLFLQLPPPREAQQVAAFMRGRHHRRQRCLPSLFRLCPSFGRDRNYRRRTLLILALATDNTAADRPLLRQLLRETQRSYTLGLSWDIRDAVAVLAYLLYRHLHYRDIPLLWTARHSGGSDTYYSLDAEITFGFDATDTLHHLAKKRPPRRADRDMAADIRHYLAQKDSHFRSRTDYLAHCAARRLPLHLETLKESLT
jgi:hypothetical protein